MKRLEVRVIGGILLIAAGVLSLLQNLGIFEGALAFLWALLLGAGGAFFLYVFLINRANWWAIIPGFTMLSVATLIAFQTIVNIGMNLNLLPVTGLPLPFISYGGSSLLTTLLGIGLVESVILRHKALDF